jgi:hypothetical protein
MAAQNLSTAAMEGKAKNRETLGDRAYEVKLMLHFDRAFFAESEAQLGYSKDEADALGFICEHLKKKPDKRGRAVGSANFYSRACATNRLDGSKAAQALENVNRILRHRIRQESSPLCH